MSLFVESEEQVMLRDSVRRWVADAPSNEADHWPLFADMGWLAASLPETVDGLGGGMHAAAIIAEELGRGLRREPFVELAVTAAQLLLKLDPKRARGIGTGSARPLFAHDEAEARGDQSWIGTRATRQGDGWRLTGRKTGLYGAAHADTLIVSAIAEGHGPSLFELPAAEAPLRHFRTVDDREGAELRLDGTATTPLGSLGGAEPAILHAADCALVLSSAEAVGSMERVLTMTRDYLNTRKQFGKAIGEFQALRHRLADMLIDLEQARSIVLRGLLGLESEQPRERARLAAATKARVAQSAALVGAQGIQLHGGIGVTEEYPVGHFFKRLTAFGQRHGSAAVQVERFASLSLPVQRGA